MAPTPSFRVNLAPPSQPLSTHPPLSQVADLVRNLKAAAKNGGASEDDGDEDMGEEVILTLILTPALTLTPSLTLTPTLTLA